MKLPILKPHQTLPLAVIGALILFNAFLVNSAILGGILLILFLWGASFRIGTHLIPTSTLEARAGGLATILATTSTVGTILYYLAPVPKTLFGALFLVILLTILAIKPKTINPLKLSHNQKNTAIISAAILSLIALGAWWFTLSQHTITQSVRSPWLIVAPASILAVGLAAFFIFTFLRTKQNDLALTSAAILFFSTIAVALIVFPLGYGFDPFIHQATVTHIAEHGTITPKPLYYIGQYALELISVHIFALPLSLVDRLLVPALASILIVASAWTGLRNMLKNQFAIAIIGIFLLPLGSFIFTTPQSLAFIFTLALLFYSFPILSAEKETKKDYRYYLFLALLAICTAAIHPLAGIPALLYLALIACATLLPKPVHIIATTVVGVFSAIAMPLLFIVQARMSNLSITFKPSQLFHFSKLNLESFFASHFHPWLDFAYAFIGNHFLILLALAAVGIAFMIKHRAKPLLFIPAIAAAIWFVNYSILSTTLSFEFLIEYERQNYTVRLLTLTMFFLVPYVCIAIAGIFNALKEKRLLGMQTVATFLLVLAFCANVYGTYPRHDGYARSGGFNVSKTDIIAVTAIEQHAQGESYIALANQAVSAAALAQYGFKEYFHETIFYYPIPTGGDLYNYYMQMTSENPSRATMLQAMDLAGVDVGYFVLNNYWWQADQIRERAKQEADEWFSIESDTVSVFVFRRDHALNAAE